MLLVEVCLPFVHYRGLTVINNLLLCTAFYIPPQWLSPSDPKPNTILEAARLVSRLTHVNTSRVINNTEIPLIVHQTWKNTDVNTWPDLIRDSVDKWMEEVVATPMAYFLWNDDGVVQFLEAYEPEFMEHFSALPRMVEKSDIFRIMVSKYIGGIVSFPVVATILLILSQFFFFFLFLHANGIFLI